jgi:hypothetical protein
MALLKGTAIAILQAGFNNAFDTLPFLQRM